MKVTRKTVTAKFTFWNISLLYLLVLGDGLQLECTSGSVLQYLLKSPRAHTAIRNKALIFLFSSTIQYTYIQHQ